MTREDFTREFADMLGIDPHSLTLDLEMASLPEWDSVAYLSAMVLIDEKLAVTIRPDVISNSKTYGEILVAVQSAFQD